MKRYLLLLFTALAFAALAVPLEVMPQNGMTIVSAQVDGVDCTLLVDTGASHTTLDIGFVTNRLHGVALREVELVGRTNVMTPPKFATVEKLVVGDAEFAVEGLMALDLKHLSSSVGRRIDGILGMNHLRAKPCLISLGRKLLVWDPSLAEIEGFKPARARDRGTTYEILALGPNDERLALLADTGSSFTFVSGNRWEAGEKELRMGATDVNSRTDFVLKKGKKGEIRCGENLSLEIEPVLSEDDYHNQLGADVFKKVDILLKNNHLYLRF